MQNKYNLKILFTSKYSIVLFRTIHHYSHKQRKDPIKIICIVLLFSFPLKTEMLQLEVISNDTSFRLSVIEYIHHSCLICNGKVSEITNGSPKTPALPLGMV